MRSRGLLAIALLWPLTACGWMYFHDEEFEKQAKQTLDTVKTIDASAQIGAFDKRLDELQQQYELQYAEQLLTLRNTTLALAIKGDPLRGLGPQPTKVLVASEVPDGLQLLAEEVDRRLLELTGKPVATILGPDRDGYLRLASNLDRALRRVEIYRKDLEGYRAATRRQALAQGTKLDLSCEKAIEKHAEMTKDAAAKAASANLPYFGNFTVLAKLCAGIGTEIEEAVKPLPNIAKPAARALASATLASEMTPAKAGAASGGADGSVLSLAAACVRQRDWLREAFAVIDTPQSSLLPPGQARDEAALLAGAKNLGAPDGLFAAITKSLAENSAAAVGDQNCVKAIDAGLKKLADTAAKAGDAKEGDAKSKAALDDFTKTLTAVRDALQAAHPEAKVKVLEGLGDVLDALVKADLQRLAGERTSDPLASGNSDCALATAKSPAQGLDPCAVNAAVTFLTRTATAFRQLTGEGADKRVRSTIVRLAALRREKALAEIDLKAERAKADILRRQLMAAASETSNLTAVAIAISPLRGGDGRIAIPTADATFVSLAADNHKRFASFALAAYSQAWKEGRIPLQVLAIRPRWIDHRALLAKDVATAKSSKEIIDQALAAIHAYAQGGIVIKDLLDLLAKLGIIGAIAG